MQERLDRIREGSRKRIPPEHRAVMLRATEELRATGILDRVLRPGDPMPGFRLANTRGKTVDSADLLKNGPLVVSFFRGKW
ncbi:MAG: hypothetical protein ACE5H3_00225 [Planctomycetota bacterium]